jgi:hypothetical protein
MLARLSFLIKRGLPFPAGQFKRSRFELTKLSLSFQSLAPQKPRPLGAPLQMRKAVNP